MSEEEIVFKEILIKFSKIPIPEDETTFLDLCHYSGERFEEICSRILEFYFQPNNKHGFGNLWFRSLCQLIGIECNDEYDMKTRTEEYTYGAGEKSKKIDIVIETPSVVIAIENKIGAMLYNPLDVYKEHVDKIYEKKQERKLVVLTAHILSGQEIRKAEQYGFKIINYLHLFRTVKSLIGDYMYKGNQKYLVYMLDFIRTVENRANMAKQNELDKFFYTHKGDIEQLFAQFSEWKSRIMNEQKPIISDLYTKIQQLTEDTAWWVYQGWDLGRSFKDKTPYRIGIESNFAETSNNPIGEYHIYITTWNLNCWTPYESDILKRYPGYYLDKGEKNSSNRVYYHMPVIERAHYDSNENYFEVILNRLQEYYQFLKSLSERISTE